MNINPLWRTTKGKLMYAWLALLDLTLQQKALHCSLIGKQQKALPCSLIGNYRYGRQAPGKEM